MASFYESFSDAYPEEITDPDVSIPKPYNNGRDTLQHILLVASTTLVVLIGLISVLTYCSLRKISPAGELTSYRIERFLNSIRSIISTNVTPTHNDILIIARYLCIGIVLCTAALLYMLCARWLCIFPSWNVVYNLDLALAVALEYLGISVYLSIISSPQINGIICFPRTLLLQAISMAVAIILFIATSLFSGTMHK